MLLFWHRLLNILEVIAPFKQFNKLREFLQQRLPPGFPVKIGTAVYVLHGDTATTSDFMSQYLSVF